MTDQIPDTGLISSAPDPNAFDPSAWDFPGHWSASASDAVRNVLTERPDLAGGELAALEQAAELVTLADALASVATAAGYTALGSAGQTVLHPATAEGRLARTSAATILRALAPLSPAKARRIANLKQGKAE